MTEREASGTAVAVAALRAAHRIFDAPPWILDDPVAERLLDHVARDRLRSHPGQLAHPRIRALRANVLLRSRYVEDRLAAAVERGVRQALILGAGYDTFAYRQPAWADVLHIIEVDHSASQNAKRERLQAAGIIVPGNVEFLALDVERGSLGAGLKGSGFDPAKPAFVSWLGVMADPRSEAGMFRFAASLPATSEMVFAVSPPIEPAAIEAMLREVGFSAVTLLRPEDAAARYFHDRSDGLPAPEGVRIGSAVV